MQLKAGKGEGMRIVVDMQGAQSTGSRDRGIGRYTISLVKAMVRQRSNHDIVLVLNGAFPETIESIRAAFCDILPQEKIHVWYPLTPTARIDAGNTARRNAAELIYEAFLVSHSPDFIFVSSLFEGLTDDSITSIHRLQKDIPVAVTLYDLIPYINPSPYLDNPSVKSWYLDKIDLLRRADLWLAISESSRQEGLDYLGLPKDESVNISTDADERFKPITVSVKQEEALRARYGLSKKFVMYTGGFDHRKNIDGLIRAYANLPETVRRGHQLAIVCSIPSSRREELEVLALQQGLRADELVLTGYVSDEDLLILYNICQLFIFPSWHEGFGLPALEAMRCNAPVIGANTSSLPEVIGWEEALFDPHVHDSMTTAIEKALTDESYRQALIRHGKKQARSFSWDDSARKALDAMEWRFELGKPCDDTPIAGVTRCKLAYVSPLPPAHSGIADYSADLLPELMQYYDIDVIVEQEDEITDSWILENCPIRSVQWLVEHADQYDRILYHFGNSSFHQHMFGLLESLPGVVVLHDFFLSGVQAHREGNGSSPHAYAQALYKSHGFFALRERFTDPDFWGVVNRYPANLLVLQRALGVVVHSVYSRGLARYWYGNNAGRSWSTIPLLRSSCENSVRATARDSLGFAPDDLLVCSFGMLGPHKLNARLLRAWMASPMAKDKKAHLVFVGENCIGDYGQSLLLAISASGAAKRIKITGWADAKLFRDYLAAADIGVQLRTMSRGETSAAVLDCMNHGLATIVNANGSMIDLDPEGVWMLPDEFSDIELVTALTVLAKDQQRRVQLGARAAEIVRSQHAPRQCAQQYFDAIEHIYQSAQSGVPALMRGLARTSLNAPDLVPLAVCMARNFPPPIRRRQWLVDISTLVQSDAKTGIQRVVRAILREWLENPPEGFQVEPVYATTDAPGYHYARQFTSDFLGIPVGWGLDEPVDAWAGDVFVGLDLQPLVVPAQQAALERWRADGIEVWFVIYDLLPVLLPTDNFPPGSQEGHQRWLRAVSHFDGLVCISRSVANEAKKWLITHGPERQRPLSIKSFHLGADVSASMPTRGMPPDASNVLKGIARNKSFLMVGTIEPRKGYAQILDAFDELWRTGVDVSLVIVGKAGWKVDLLVGRLRDHDEAGRRLFWLEGVSDEYLEAIYAASTCLIAASYGEGFGLPLIEAAQHKLPVIARDIPVFREVAGDQAFYFEAKEPKEFAHAVCEWLRLHKAGMHPRSDVMSWLTWKESAKSLVDCITLDK